MKNFSYVTPSRLLFGVGYSDKLPEELRLLGADKILLLTGKNSSRTERISEIICKLKKDFPNTIVFSDIPSDPQYQVTESITNLVRNDNIDTIVGIGGGSVLDVAKIVSVLMTNSESIEELFGVNQINNKGINLLLMPTTAGTGSEVTHISILSDDKAELKKGIVSDHLLPTTAILDPQLTISCPAHVTAFTGMDALIHAMEAYTSRFANIFTDTLAIKAIELISKNILSVFHDGTNLKSRYEMLLGSMLAGKAFANAGVTAVHAFAYPIGAKYHIPHGVANAIMLPHVFKHNLDSLSDRFSQINQIINQNNVYKHQLPVQSDLISTLNNLINQLKLPVSLREFGTTEKDIPELSKSVLKVTRLLNNNVKKIDLTDAETIYKSAL